MLTWFWQLLAPLNWITSLFIVVIGSGLYTIISIVLVRKFARLDNFGTHRDFTSAIFANFGVLYSVVLAFIILNAQDAFNNAQTAITQEAGQLSQLYRDTIAFSEKDKIQIRHAIITYTESIIHNEWGAAKPNEETSRKFSDLWTAYNNTQISNEKQKIWYAQSLSDLNQLSTFRSLRLDSASTNISSEMWSFLILGKYAFLAFLCCFRPKKATFYLIMAFLFAGIISASLYLTYSLDTPFSGNNAVISEIPFENILRTWAQQ